MITKTKTSLRTRNAYFLAVVFYNFLSILLLAIIWLVFKMTNEASVVNPTDQQISDLARISDIEFGFIGFLFGMSLLLLLEFISLSESRYKSAYSNKLVYFSNLPYVINLIMMIAISYVLLSLFSQYSQASDYLIYAGWYRFIVSILSISFCVSMILSIFLTFKFLPNREVRKDYEYK